MSIDARCQEQQSAADRMFMDFKYTRPGSKEQLQFLTKWGCLTLLLVVALQRSKKPVVDTGITN